MKKKFDLISTNQETWPEHPQTFKTESLQAQLTNKSR